MFEKFRFPEEVVVYIYKATFLVKFTDKNVSFVIPHNQTGFLTRLYLLPKLLCSWDNQILNFQCFNCYDVIICLSTKHETYLLNNLESKHSLMMKFRQFLKNFMKNKAWKLVPSPFLSKKESEEMYLLIQTNFDSFAIIYLI